MLKQHNVFIIIQVKKIPGIYMRFVPSFLTIQSYN